MTVEKAASKVEFPAVPVQTLEDGRQVENPNHPDYLKARQDAFRKASMAGLDVMIVFCDLIDGLPTDDGWIKKLRYLEKLGHIEVS